jgi:hypothetical protein
MQIEAAEYRGLDLRAHSLLASVPLHDVWAVDLPGGGPDRRVADVRALFDLGAANAATRALFALRRAIGTWLGWDRERGSTALAPNSLMNALSDADRAASEIAPGTRDGPFRVLYVFPREAVSEIENATVAAWSVQALVPHAGGYRFYWAIYVREIGAITRPYMMAIEPFRRWIVYPSILRALRRGWDTLDSPR